MAPPKRMSDILASSSIDTRITSTSIPTAVPYSSEGPTLPIIGATSEHSTKVPGNGKKRKRTTSDESAKPNKAAAVEGKEQSTREGVMTNHPSLYEPWVLLEGKEGKAIEARGTENVVPIVYSRNQNVKSGITKLLRYLDLQTNDKGGDLPAALKSDEGIIAVSAQGEGTVKLVGIVDMVRRIAGKETQKKGSGANQAEEGEKWYMYTVLSSVVVPRKRSTESGAQNDADEAQEENEGDVDVMDVDRGDGAVKETVKSSKGEGEMRKVAVLTVWMTRKRISVFRDAFGEQEFVVHKTES
ncbi:hypothetical protein BU25DRAFT_213073 [Macroventuria anomochaeta]|uniref:Uncharacterized protein n=1 Tax=Macroventuria anomochaeta TaxID=301207 RepID=A0ACB6RKI9_9PLEO|nr:uncharacterized protein BU25DRAFT_213073 [Macroventuria anomochaeta]KAF2622217.1 hypothetical protein BU25DRAFT_213073 [Macroventuria anomochaeta]